MYICLRWYIYHWDYQHYCTNDTDAKKYRVDLGHIDFVRVAPYSEEKKVGATCFFPIRAIPFFQLSSPSSVLVAGSATLMCLQEAAADYFI